MVFEERWVCSLCESTSDREPFEYKGRKLCLCRDCWDLIEYVCKQTNKMK